VNHAVDVGCAYLVAKQAPDGSWGADDKVHPLGRTALALLALHHGGDPSAKPVFDRGFQYLVTRLRESNAKREKGAPPPRHSTYETGVILMLLRAVGTSESRELMAPLAEGLVETFDRSQLAWGYPEGARDLSNTQYALLGLRAAMREDIRPRGLTELLPLALKGVLRHQTEEGGFTYTPGRFPTSSMTVAGLALLQYLQEEIDRLGLPAPERPKIAAATRRAQAWFEQVFSVDYNAEGRARVKSNLYYYLYGLERYCAFYDLAAVGGRDWYEEGARFLVGDQKEDGAWGELSDTCFAILFLRRAAFTDRTGRKIVATAPIEEKEPKPPTPPPPGPAELHPDPSIPFVRQWLVAGVFFGKPGADDALETDFIVEKRATALSGQSAGTKASRKWTAFESPEDKVDLQIVTKGGDRSATYAFAWLRSETKQDAILWLGSDDGVRVFLNGEMVLDHHHHDGVPQDSLRAPLQLESGWNRLLLKVENVGYFCYFFARVSDPEGKPIGGLTWSLSPTKK
jgi:hypothetical protein